MRLERTLLACALALSATGAFASLLGPYAPQIEHYTRTYPELAAHPIRGLVVALAIEHQVQRVALALDAAQRLAHFGRLGDGVRECAPELAQHLS